jgi:hypothetical protein
LGTVNPPPPFASPSVSSVRMILVVVGGVEAALGLSELALVVEGVAKRRNSKPCSGSLCVGGTKALSAVSSAFLGTAVVGAAIVNAGP